MSVLPFAPCAQPSRQVPALTQGARPSYSRVVIALSDGHQCHPRRLKPAASVSPSLPSGTGGSGSSFGGDGGTPGGPGTPLIRGVRAGVGGGGPEARRQSPGAPA